MKRLLTLLFFASLIIAAQAQVPGTLSYQGILVNTSGEPVTDGVHTVRFRFYDALTGGTLVDDTSPIEVTTYKGLFTTIIGTGETGNEALTSDVLNAAYLGNKAIFVEIAADGNTLLPRVRLTSTINALHAHNANVAPASGITGTLSIAQGGTGVSAITGVFIGDGTNAATGVAATGGGQFFRRNIADTGYEFTDLSASNGLTVTNGNLSLGGTLGANTNIASGGFDLTFGGAGRFGISTLTPVNRLDVGGNMVVGNTYAGASTAPVNGLLVQGNVGLGTTTVNNRLDVEGGVAVGTTYSGTNTAPTNGAIIEGNVGIGTATVVNKLDVEGGAVIGTTYSGASTSPTNGLLVEGVVGIGTATPTRAILEQYGQVGTTNAIFGGGSTGISLMNAFPGIGFNWYQNAGSKAIAAGFGGYLYLDHAQGDFNFVTSAATAASANATHTGTTRLTLKNNGRLGIGTTAPANLLDVEGGIAIGTTYSGTTAAPTNGAIIEGNVGIGTNAPASMLDVNGTTTLRGYTGINRTAAITSSSVFDVEATAAAGAFGGMYINGTTATSLPFYGYATAGAAKAYHYLDGGTNTWHLNNGGNRLSVTNTGYVGIGTTPTRAALEQNSALTTTAIFGGNSTGVALATNSPGIGFNTYYDGGGSKAIGTGFGSSFTFNAATGDLYYYVSTASAAANGVFTTPNRLTILNNGNVGIGTASPATPLSVFTSTNTRGINIEQDYTGAAVQYGLNVDLTSATGTGLKYGIQTSVSGTSSNASNNYGFYSNMTPNGTGGIWGSYNNIVSAGTGARYGVTNAITSPAGNTGALYGVQNLLTSNGNSASYGNYNVISGTGTSGNRFGNYNEVYGATSATSTTYGTYNYLFHSGSGTVYGNYVDANKAAAQTGTVYGQYIVSDNDGVGDSYLMYASSVGSTTGTEYGLFVTGEDVNYFAGKVGMGTASLATIGTYKLYIVGSGFASGGTWTASDTRYKRNFIRLSSALEKIKRLEGYSYEWRREENPNMEFPEGRHYGFKAQEVEKYFPELISTHQDGYKAMNYAGMTPVLLEAIKEQQTQIEQLQSEVADLKKQLSQYQSLSAQVEELKKLVTQTTSVNTTATGGNKK